MVVERDTFTENLQEQSLTALPSLKRGERFIGILPNGVVEVEDAFAVDSTRAEGADVMRAKEAEIMAIETDEERRKAFCNLSSGLAQFADGQGSYWDLEDLYTLGAADLPRKIPDNNPNETNLWYRCFENARAVRERAIAAEALLEDAVLTRASAHPDSPVEIFSIASGSARCILNVIQRAEKRGIQVRARMLDINEEALRYSVKLAREMGVIDADEPVEIMHIDVKDANGKGIDYKDKGKRIEFMHGNVVNINGVIAARPVDVAEAVGINDYLGDLLCTHRFMPAIHRLLTSGGILVISNIVHNDEEPFLHSAVGWQQMFYRDSLEFSNLLLSPRVGFLPENLTVHQNPNGIYRTIEAQKSLQ